MVEDSDAGADAPGLVPYSSHPLTVAGAPTLPSAPADSMAVSVRGGRVGRFARQAVELALDTADEIAASARQLFGLR